MNQSEKRVDKERGRTVFDFRVGDVTVDRDVAAIEMIHKLSRGDVRGSDGLVLVGEILLCSRMIYVIDAAPGNQGARAIGKGKKYAEKNKGGGDCICERARKITLQRKPDESGAEDKER